MMNDIERHKTDSGLVCMFCGRSFQIPSDYPKDPFGFYKKLVIRLGNAAVLQPRICTYMYDEVAISGDVCPSCRARIVEFLRRKGVDI